MGATYQVERGSEPDSAHDDLVADYGWAHLHAFLGLIAAEEGIDLPMMAGYGGSRPWAEVDAPLKSLLDPYAFEDKRLPSARCLAMRPRISEIASAWSRGTYAGFAEPEMRLDQLVTLRKLEAVLDGCIETGRALAVS